MAANIRSRYIFGQGMFNQIITKAAFILGLSLAGALPAGSETVAGQEDAAYLSAREDWLAGSDTKALKALGVLARQGNTAAQILLSRIAASELTHQHVTADLPRRERIALLRKEQGLSGKDWLTEARSSSELAEALWTLNRTPDAMDAGQAVEILWDHGEAKAAINMMLEAWSRGEEDSVLQRIEASSHDLGPDGAQMLAFLKGDIDQWRVDELRGRLALEGLLEPLTSLSDASRLAKVEEIPSLEPLSKYCAATCPESVALCLRSGLRAATVAGRFPQPFASPSQSLIPDEEYWESARFQGDFSALMKAGGGLTCE